MMPDPAPDLDRSSAPREFLRNARLSTLDIIRARHQELTDQWSRGNMSDTQLEAIVVVDDIPRLLARLDTAEARAAAAEQERDDVTAALAAAQEREATLREALAIYANHDNWNGYKPGPYDIWDPANDDLPDNPADIAREALAALSPATVREETP